jgi:hypothetical protein
VPVKLRTPKERRPTFTPEIVALFAELEAVPAHERERPEFVAKSKELAALLDLSSEWWTTNHVHDRSAEPCWPEHCVAYEDWFKVRAVREALLDAVRDADHADGK